MKRLLVATLDLVQLLPLYIGIYCFGGQIQPAGKIGILCYAMLQIVRKLAPAFQLTAEDQAHKFRRELDAADHGGVFIVMDPTKVVSGMSLPKWIDLTLDPSGRFLNFTLDTDKIDRAWKTLTFVGAAGKRCHEIEKQFANASQGIVAMLEQAGYELTPEEDPKK